MKNILNFTPKAYIGALLLILALIGAIQQGFGNVITQFILAITVALTSDSFINYLKTKKISFSSSAFITGMIIALVLAPQTEWHIVGFASLIAIIQKHVLRFKKRHIFNPANFGLLATMFIFSIYPNWWGQSFWQLIVLVGVFICWKMRRLIIPLAFILTFILVFVLGNLFNEQPFLNSLVLINIFFVFVMLIEPKTSPATEKGQYIYAVLTALFSLVYFKLMPQYDFSILALATTNILMPIINKN